MEHSDTVDSATLIVKYLESIGVEYVFGVPGGAIEPLYNALAVSERRGGIKAVVARHEAGAAFMAEGYARRTGKLGVCCATSGPGATNLITGVANAYENGIPMLVITGQPAIPLWGKGALQESSCTGVNVVGLFEHCTVYNSLISHAEQIENKLTSAILRSMQSSKGPSHLAIPVDIQRAKVNSNFSTRKLKNLIIRGKEIDFNAVNKVASNINQSKSTVILIGKGCQDSAQDLMKLATHIQARFVVSPDAKGLVDQNHPLYRGVYGFAGHQSAREIFQSDVELILSFGVKFGEWTSCVWNDGLLNHKMIHIDESSENFLRTPMADLHVMCHIKSFAQKLIKQTIVEKNNNFKAMSLDELVNDPEKMKSPETPIKPQRLMWELTKRFPKNTKFLTDPGNSTAWAINYLEADVDVLMDFAPMGWSIGASIGMAMGDKKTPVVCITGDGSYLMSGQEITVAAQQEMTVIYVILNDSALGMVKHGQRLAGAEKTAFQLPEIDYKSMAQSMGIDGYIVNSPEDFNDIDFEKIINKKGPTIFDIRIDAEEVPPINLRVQTLNSRK